MTRRVVITGMGVVTPLGCDPETFWQGLSSGTSGGCRITKFDVDRYDTKIACEVKQFDPSKYLDRKSIRIFDLYCQYATYAAAQAVELAKLDLAKENLDRIGVVVGSGIGGLSYWEEQHTILMQKGPDRISPFFIPMMISNMAAGQISIRHGFRGPNSCVATACATGNHCIGDAFKIIQRNDADVMMAGGSEAAVTPMGLAGFCASKALSKRNDAPEKASRPFDRDRDGFVMGEGAGIVVLEELDHALHRGAAILAEVVGYGMSADAHHMTSPPPGGEGAVRAIRAALADGGMRPEDIDYINAHGTSTEVGDAAETQAIKTVFGSHAYQLSVSSTKSMTGHLLGAAGGVECIATVLTIQHQMVHPTINLETPGEGLDLDYVPGKAKARPVRAALSNAFGFGGHNAVLAFRRFVA